jgi:AraC-like DNA-binding protein
METGIIRQTGGRLARVTDWEALAVRGGYRIGQMAGLAQISRRELHRYFSRRFGAAPRDWLNRLKLRRASELMAEGKLVKEIAASLGFKEPSCFCHFFKRNEGRALRFGERGSGLARSCDDLGSINQSMTQNVNLADLRSADDADHHPPGWGDVPQAGTMNSLLKPVRL